MTRILAVAFVVLLVSTAPVVTFAGTVDSHGQAVESQASVAVGEVANDDGSLTSISWVYLNQPDSTGSASVEADLGSTLRMGNAQFRSELSKTGVEQRYEAATTSRERQQVLDEALAGVDAEIDDLVERENAIAGQYANGELDQAMLLYEVGTITENASRLETTVERINELAERDRDVSVQTRSTRGELLRFQTPLRTQIVQAAQAESPRTADIRVTAADDTLVLEQLKGEQYIRESVQYDERISNETDQFDSLSEVRERAAQQYPWIYDNQFGSDARWFGSVYQLGATHPNGDTTTYIDSAGGGVVHEHHVLNLGKLTTTATVTSTGDNLSVSTHRVPDGGPIWVSVTDAETDEPVTATVAVNDDPVGTTDDDGELWATAPGGDVTVTATVGEDEEEEITLREPSS